MQHNTIIYAPLSVHQPYCIQVVVDGWLHIPSRYTIVLGLPLVSYANPDKRHVMNCCYTAAKQACRHLFFFVRSYGPHSEESCLCQQKHHWRFNHLVTWLCQLRQLHCDKCHQRWQYKSACLHASLKSQVKLFFARHEATWRRVVSFKTWMIYLGQKAPETRWTGGPQNRSVRFINKKNVFCLPETFQRFLLWFNPLYYVVLKGSGVLQPRHSFLISVIKCYTLRFNKQSSDIKNTYI
jgi:hypothetical protein